MATLDGVLIETDVLVIGGGAGGLLAALSAKRHGPAGTRVTLADSWLIGRTGHTALPGKSSSYRRTTSMEFCARSSRETTVSPTRYWYGTFLRIHMRA